MDCIPPDWGDGYENVTVGCTVENQAESYRRLPLFDTLPIVHKNIIIQPMLEKMNIERHLGDVELVVVGGESDRNARPLDYAWVLDVREQCLRQGVKFEFRQCGSNFVKDGKLYQLPVRQLMSQARKANINT
jgi:protein gp37